MKLGRDLGREVEILSGITLQGNLVLNPSDSINEGDVVKAQPAPEEKPKAAAAPPKPASGAA